MSKKERERVRPPGSKEIRVSDVQRFVLFQIVQQFRPRDMSDMRALGATFRDFDLEEIEAKAKAGGVAGEAYGDREQVLFVPESTALYLGVQFDRLTEVYPAGKTPDGTAVPAGLPVYLARTLAPLLEQLETTFPAMSKKPEAKAP